MNDKIKNYISLVFVLLLSLGVIYPLSHQGFFPMHDDTQVARVFEMGKSLRDGMVPVRWISDLGYGYGYPIFTFYGPLAYCVGGMFSFLTDALLATKIMIVVSVVASGLSMYLLGKSLWGRLGGLLSAVLYLYAPYHAVDLYVRGDIGELYAYAFFPLALLGIWFLYKKPSMKGVLVGAVGFAGVVTSHNLSAFLFAPFLILLLSLVSVFSKEKEQTIFFSLRLLILALLLSAFYVLPVFGEMRYTNVLSQIGGGANFRDHFVCLPQLWQSPWGYGGSVPGCNDGLSFMIGKLQVIFAVVGLVLSFTFWKKFGKKSWVIIVSAALSLLAVFLMLSNSQFIWEAVPQMAFLQYPWRYLLLVCLFLSIIGGALVILLERINRVVRIIGVVLICCFVVVFSLKYFQPQKFLDVQSSYYTNKEQLNWTTSKISDEYMPRGFQKPTKIQDVPSALVVIKNGSARVFSSKTQKYFIGVNADQKTRGIIHIAYFPAWKARLDNKVIQLIPEKNGMSFAMPKGNHMLAVSYEQTDIELMGDFTSLTGILIVVLGILYARKKRT